MKFRAGLPYAAALLALALAGCARGPGDNDIAQAIQANYRANITNQISLARSYRSDSASKTDAQIAQAIGVPLPDQLTVQVDSAEQLDRDSNGNYEYKVKLTINEGSKSRQESDRVVMQREGNGWQTVSIADD